MKYRRLSARLWPQFMQLNSKQFISRRELYGDSAERMKHRRYIEVIADELNQPVHTIVPLYEDVLAEMRARARVTDFLPILVSKRLKNLLRT